MINTINCMGKLLDISTPVVMGILNITPDSFYDGGKFNDESNSLAAIDQMLMNGASIIDIGAVSTRPGAPEVSEDEEWNRLFPLLSSLKAHFPSAIFSLDTSSSLIARKGLDLGISIINDITAGKDAGMLQTVASFKCPYIMMHMQGNPQNMQKDPTYQDVTREVLEFFVNKTEQARNAGITDIIIDPGFGFGKTTEHNFRLLKDLDVFQIIAGLPVLAGISRKSMINKTLNIKVADALNGTTAVNMIALMNGARILRVHDVKEAVEAVQLYKAYIKS